MYNFCCSLTYTNIGIASYKYNNNPKTKHNPLWALTLFVGHINILQRHCVPPREFHLNVLCLFCGFAQGYKLRKTFKFKGWCYALSKSVWATRIMPLGIVILRLVWPEYVNWQNHRYLSNCNLAMWPLWESKSSQEGQIIVCDSFTA